MKRTLFLIYTLTLGFMLSSQAQTQRGYVKTLGRPGRPGEPLSGVTVRMKGAHNAMLSQDDGTFSIDMTGKKTGDAYVLQQVSKTGYELNESEVIGRQFAYSEQVPLTLVMVSTAQLQADKQRIEANAYQAAERNYQQMYAELEKQLVDSIISAEKYREQLQALQDGFLNYQTLIAGLAEHYAHLDYDHLDEKEREISECIENGELERADSLLQALFDPTDVLQRNMDALAEIDRQIAEAQDIILEANADMAAVLKQQAKDAEYLYQLYTIALARFDNEKARFYIETRAELDTTNVQWQLEAGEHILEYVADYEASLAIGQRAYRQAQLQFGEYNELVCNTYNQIGLSYDYLGKYDSALFYFERMLETSLQTFGEESFYTAAAYSLLASVFGETDNNEKRVEYALKALSIREKLPGQPRIAESYHNLAGWYSKQHEFDIALDYYRRALAIDREEKGAENYYTAYFYDGLGLTFQRMELYDSALYYHQKSCSLREKIVGHYHPITAYSYINSGTLYRSMGNDSLAMENYLTGIDIEEKTHGPNHPELIESYKILGSMYSHTKNYPKSLECYLRALSLIQLNYGTNYPRLGIVYNLIGTIYGRLQDLDKALEYYHMARELIENTVNRNEQHLGTTYNNLGTMYAQKQDYSQALKYYNLALTVFEKEFGSDHPSTKKIQEKIADVQAKMNEQ